VQTGTQSVRTALRIVEEVGRRGSVGVSELARELALPKSTVQRTLATLGEFGWLRRDDTSRWSLTLRCATVGRSTIDEHAIRAAGRPVLDELRDRTGETTRWFVIEGSTFVLLGTAESTHAVRPVESELPGPIPVHATAVGKATMARWSPDELSTDAIGALRAMTPKTITSLRALKADLAETSRRGWGQVDEELYLDVGGVAAVAPVPGDRLVGVGVSYPLHRTTPSTIRRYGGLVVAAAPKLADAVAPLL
jgi:DNA-binding IclR family transcriptional regulator